MRFILLHTSCNTLLPLPLAALHLRRTPTLCSADKSDPKPATELNNFLCWWFPVVTVKTRSGGAVRSGNATTNEYQASLYASSMSTCRLRVSYYGVRGLLTPLS